MTCPFGFLIGEDHDRHEQCDECPEDKYQRCGALFNPTGDPLYVQLVKYYKGKGYVAKRHFPGEYMLLIHPRTISRIRVYEHGDIWRLDRLVGEYEKIPIPEDFKMEEACR